MGKIRNRQLDSGRGINDRKYKAEGNYQLVKPKWEEDRVEKAKAFHIQPKNFNQELMLKSMRENIITIGSGSAGSGKTYSSILLAKGLTKGDLSKVAIIDTENGSADLYADLGNYNVLSLAPPYTPENYIKAIELCEKEGMEVIIIDSISHAWDELLDFHSKLAGNSWICKQKV